MSLWWAKRDQLDDYQVDLIEKLPHRQNYLVMGPPGSGKTNVLLRRAQFVRTQNFPNVMVLSFTRALTEFVKTGCFNSSGDEIFPTKLVNTVESWIRYLYKQHDRDLPSWPENDFPGRKAAIAREAQQFHAEGKLPNFDVLFVDEAQDLIAEEVELLAQWGENLFFVGDSRQKIYEISNGLPQIRALIPHGNEKRLPFHYRIAPEICAVADRILRSTGEDALAESEHYTGPRPGEVEDIGPLDRDGQLRACADRLVNQLRLYGDFIDAGDMIGVVVPYADDRQRVLEGLEEHSRLAGLSQIIRARSGNRNDSHHPGFDHNRPICILTAQAVKGLEFRALNWLFCDELSNKYTNEIYYTVVTRAKSALYFYHSNGLPATLARAYSKSGGGIW